MLLQARSMWYRALIKKLPTRLLFHQMGIIDSPQCLLCKNQAEDLDHLLAACSIRWAIWTQALAIYYPDLSFNQAEILKSVKLSCSPSPILDQKRFYTIMSTIQWCIWKAYWNFVFDQQPIHLSSYPEKESKYGWITVIKVQEDNTTKLKIGTTTFNLLATSSLRLGKSSSLSIQIGSNTSHFAPAQSTSIYLDVASIKLANLLIENESATSINQETYLYQLRQVRSKFYCLSTYTRCRSFSSIARNIAFRPYTIWTLYEYDTPQKTNSQAKMLSSIFQTIACSVIRNGSSARVNVNCFKNVKDQLKDNVTKSTLAQILELEEDGFIAIINNFELNSLLQPLADSMSTSIKDANLNAAKQLEMSLKA